jgi:RHS repeat-associated protein
MTFQFLCTDAMSSVLNLLSADDTSQTQCFSPYGVQKHSLTNTPGFNGERRDPLTGLTHLGNGYRAYNPQLMRFQAPDSISPFGKGGINSYVYCEDDPVNRSDPSGHMSTFDTVSIIFGALGLAVGVVAAGMSISAYRGAKAATVVIAGSIHAQKDIANVVGGVSDVVSSAAGKTSRTHRGKKLTKELVGPSLHILASSSGIASAVENDQGNKQAAKILGVLSLASYGLATVAAGIEFRELRRHPDPYAGRLSIGVAILGTAALFSTIHEGAALTGYILEKEEQKTGGSEGGGTAEAPDNPANGYLTQNSNNFSSNQEAFINPQGRPDFTQMSNRNKPQWPTMEHSTTQQTNSRLLF